MTEPDWKRLVHETKRKNNGLKLASLAIGVLAVFITGAWYVQKTYLSFTPPAPEPVAETKSVYDGVVLSAKSAIVYDLTTGEVLYEKNAEAQLPLASLTKLLTLYAAAGTIGNAPVTMTATALSQEGESGFSEGEVFDFRELAKLAIVASSNDAAEAIVEAAGKARNQSREALLASVSSALGLSQTYAVNGTGLDENGSLSGGYGSAKDIAVLAGEFLKRIPEIAHATLSPEVTAFSKSGASYTLKNTNPDVEHVPGLRLSKTGFTDLAGGNLAIVYDAGINHPIAIVVLGSTRDDRFLDVSRLVRATGSYFTSLSLP